MLRDGVPNCPLTQQVRAMSRDRLRSNVQVRTAGVDPSMAVMIVGLVVSALVLLTMLGSRPDSRHSRQPLPQRTERAQRNAPSIPAF
jgi:hypothetical protein